MPLPAFLGAAATSMPERAMTPREFIDCHRPALERDQVRHTVLLTIIDRMVVAEEAPPGADDKPRPLWWTLGSPGQCAAQMPNYPIMLGDLAQAQCRALAEQTYDLPYPAVVGPDETAHWFVERSAELGATIGEPIPQEILALRQAPVRSIVPGHARGVEAGDGAIFADWTAAFMHAAVPHDPVPSRTRLMQMAGDGRYQFWIVDGEPVSMAGIVRRTRAAAAIAGVYTPPALRGRGYAGAVTAAVVDSIFAEGRTAACLYVDLRNPYSMRCYAKIGFRPVCRSHYIPLTRVVAPTA
jgi:GNAT superfamily N-acetyltransferase